MSYTQITHEEIEEEREIAKHRVAFLDAKLAALPLQQRQQLADELAKTAAGAVKMLCDKLALWKIQLSSDKPIRMDLRILSSSEMPTRNGRTVSAAAWPEIGVVGLLNHLALAPKEVLRTVVIHECLHLMYPFMPHEFMQQPKIRSGILLDYKEEHRAEEEWVRRMEARICGLNHNLEYWELSVE